MLAYTGHPLLDVGIAALTAFSRHDAPAALTTADLEHAAGYLVQLYTTHPAMRRFADGVVFHNSPYIRGSDPAARAAYVGRVLYGWQPGAPTTEDACAFCARPARYRASRRDIPMLNGEGYINFSPSGRAGLPLCGYCSLALHMLPLGCVKCGGGLIAAHSDDPALTLYCARTALTEMLRVLALPGLERLPGVLHEKTRLVDLLIAWCVRAAPAGDQRPPSLTACVFTNNGSAPEVRLYHLASPIVGFLRAVLRDADLNPAWDRAVARAWGARRDETDPALLPNHLYEALLSLPESAPHILRRHLLPVRHWGLAALFLRRIIGMESERIDLLRDLGDRFARYAAADRGFFFGFTRTPDYAGWRRLLLRAAYNAKRETGAPLITMDEFIAAFTAPPGEFNDWRLARDLITLRLIEHFGADEDDALFDDQDDATA